MENLKVETLMDSFKRLEDIVRCAVCLEVVRLDMVQCVNGHLLCSECKADLKECPTCRGAFSPDKPSGFHTQVVEALPRRCKHKNCGYYLNTDDDHEKYCGYRVTSCKICEWTGPGKDILEHVTVTDKSEVYTEKDTTAVCRFVSPGPGTGKESVYAAYSVHNTFLWRELSLKRKTFVTTFHYVPNGKPSIELYVELKMNSNLSNFSSKMKLTLDPDVDEEENSIPVPWKMISDFINKDNIMRFNVHITQIGTSGSIDTESECSESECSESE